MKKRIDKRFEDLDMVAYNRGLLQNKNLGDWEQARNQTDEHLEITATLYQVEKEKHGEGAHNVLFETLLAVFHSGLIVRFLAQVCLELHDPFEGSNGFRFSWDEFAQIYQNEWIPEGSSLPKPLSLSGYGMWRLEYDPDEDKWCFSSPKHKFSFSPEEAWKHARGNNYDDTAINSEGYLS